jgi:hypothetical protein
MDDFIGRLVANTGVDRTAAEKAVGIFVRPLLEEGRTEKVRALIRDMPGADAAMLAADPSSSMFGALGGLMGVGGQLMAARLSMGQIQAVVRETMSFAREKAGEDAVGEIVGGIPGLG